MEEMRQLATSPRSLRASFRTRDYTLRFRVEALGSRDLKVWSFGFKVVPREWRNAKEEGKVRLKVYG